MDLGLCIATYEYKGFFNDEQSTSNYNIDSIISSMTNTLNSKSSPSPNLRHGGGHMNILMQNDNDCGPVAEANAMGLVLADVKKKWGWKDHNSWRDDVLDSPLHHMKCHLDWGFQPKVRICHDILEGRATPGKTVVLVCPDAASPVLTEHWVVYLGRAATGQLQFNWGYSADGDPNHYIRELTDADFQAMYSHGPIACALEPVKTGGISSLSWVQEEYIKFTRAVA